MIGSVELGLYDYGKRFYDPQIGRFTTQDAYTEKYFPLTPYQYAANNPIKFIDVNGDSLFITNAILQNNQLSAAFGQFAGTKQGMAYLSKYAAKGQSFTIGDKTFSFDKDGEYSKTGVDLKYTAEDLGDGGGWGTITFGQTAGKVNEETGRMDLTITMNDNSNALDQSPDVRTYNAFNLRVFNSTTTYFHESFIHGQLTTADFLDNRLLDNSNISAQAKKALPYPEHYQHAEALLNDARYGANNTSLWPGTALQGLQQVNTNLNLNRTTNTIKYIMWNYNGGKQ